MHIMVTYTRLFQLSTCMNIYYLTFVAGVNFPIYEMDTRRSKSDLNWFQPQILIAWIMIIPHRLWEAFLVPDILQD